MKIVRDLFTLALAVTFATVTLILLPMPQASNYGSMPSTLSQAPLEDLADKSLVAVGLVSKKSVMDGPSKDIKPTKPPPSVPEHAPQQPNSMPEVKDQPPQSIKPTEPKSSEMTGVPPTQPQPPPTMPTPVGPQPGPQPSTTDSTSMSSVSKSPVGPQPSTTDSTSMSSVSKSPAGTASAMSSATTSVISKQTPVISK